MITKYKQNFEPFLRTLAKPFRFINPNVITILGVIPPAVFVYFMSQNNYTLAFVALVASTFDTLDGLVARMTNRTTTFGAFLDSTFDRIYDSLYLAGFGAAGIVAWELVITAITAAFTISYARAKVEALTYNAVKLNVGLMERPERIVAMGIILLGQIFAPTHIIELNYQAIDLRLALSLSEVLFAISTALFAYTAFQRIVAAAKHTK